MTVFPSLLHSDILRRDASTNEHIPDLAQELKLTWHLSEGCNASSLVRFIGGIPLKQKVV